MSDASSGMTVCQKKYSISDVDIDDFVATLMSAAEVVLQVTIVPVVLADPDDGVVIATALDGKAEVIGTRDQHFADLAVN